MTSSEWVMLGLALAAFGGEVYAYERFRVSHRPTWVSAVLVLGTAVVVTCGWLIANLWGWS